LRKKNIGKIISIIVLFLCPFLCNLYFQSLPFNNDLNSPILYSRNNYYPDLSKKDAKLISDNPYEDIEPAIAIDSSNIVHIVWSAYNNIDGKNHIMYTNSTDFSTKKQISNSSTDDDDPCITVDSSDIVHIAWKGSTKIYYTNSSVNYLNYTLISQQTSADVPQIICDSSGIVHIVWEGYQSGNWDVFYANSTDSFNNTIQVSRNYLDDEDPDICVTNGVVHIVWEKETDYYDNEIAYTNSTDDYSTDKIISQKGTSFYCPKIAPDNAGNVHVTWFGSTSGYIREETLMTILLISFYLSYFNDAPFLPPRSRYYYSSYPYFMSSFYYFYNYHIYYTNNKNNFQTQLDIYPSGMDDSYWPDIVIDSNNVTHIMWYSYTGLTSTKLLYTNSTVNFQVFKTYSLDIYNKYPKLANDTGNLIHCVFVSYYNNYDIYYNNITDFELWSSSILSVWDLARLLIAIPNVPDLSIFAIIFLTILGGFNCAAIIIFLVRNKEKPPTQKIDKKNGAITSKKRGKKIIIEGKGKKVKVGIP